MSDFPEFAPPRPLWLMTLADLALLLVGFLVLVQATNLDRRALADGLREGFGVAPAEPIPLAAIALPGFAAGSAALPGPTGAIVTWAREALRDPRVSLRIAGSSDGSAGDVDAATGSGAVLAADRARAVAAVLARAERIAPDRITISNASAGGRQVVVSLGFAGEQP